jgi:hypothetical protein
MSIGVYGFAGIALHALLTNHGTPQDESHEDALVVMAARIGAKLQLALNRQRPPSEIGPNIGGTDAARAR